MRELLDAGLVGLVLADLLLLGVARLGACIRVVALQGVTLGLVTLALHAEDLGPRIAFLVLLSVAVKGALFPWMLRRSSRRAGVKREVEPYLGFTPSLLLGLVLLALSVGLAERLRLPQVVLSPLALPAAFFTILTGLLLIVSRRTAIMQVLGYLVFENGIFAFGIALAADVPLLVELGVLLDAVVAVFVMGITIFHITREFDSVDTAQLSALREE